MYISQLLGKSWKIPWKWPEPTESQHGQLFGPTLREPLQPREQLQDLPWEKHGEFMEIHGIFVGFEGDKPGLTINNLAFVRFIMETEWDLNGS